MRLAAIRTNCPECGARAGFACVGARAQPRKAVHLARLQEDRKAARAAQWRQGQHGGLSL